MSRLPEDILTSTYARRDRMTNLRVQAAGGKSSSASSSEYTLTPVLTAVAVACMGALAFGFHLGVVNGPLEAIAADLGFPGDKALQGMVVSSTLAGAALGSLGGGGLSDMLGRKKSFLLAALLMLLGPLLSAGAMSLNAMLAGRFVTGIAIGLSSALVPTYISEIAPTRVRGTLGALNQLMICVGILAALLVNVVLPVEQWRAMFLLAVIPALVLGLGMLASPESPPWLAQAGNRASADAAARQLWGPSGPSELKGDTSTLAAGAGIAHWHRSGMAPHSGAMPRPVLIGVVLFALQQFAGINAIVYFSTSVFRSAGVVSDTAASAAVGVTNVLGTIVAAWLMDRAGRKQLLGGSFLGQACAMFIMAAGFSLAALKPYAGSIAVAGTLLYVLSFAMGAGPVPGLIVPELNAAKIRGRAVAAAMTSHWICNVAVGQYFIQAVAAYGLSNVYIFFGSVALLGALYVEKAIPETKGKSLDAIQDELQGGSQKGGGFNSGGGPLRGL
ncbi:MAG: hypothetical protein WDW38_008366 [Sanguina aurantia]